MSGLNLVIQFDNPSATYYCGDTVSGRIYLTADSEREIKAFTVCIRGFADVKWSESSRRNTSTTAGVNTRTTKKRIYQNHEVYFEHTIHLLGLEGNASTTLPVGEHSYPFHTVLPHNLPSSFVGTVGSVQYCVEGVVSRSWKLDRKCLAVFTVLSPLDLNLFPETQCRVQSDKEQPYGWCCWGKESIVVVASLPRSGYLPNQEIPLTIEVDNRSSLTVDNLVCTLRETVTYRSKIKNKNKIETKDLVTAQFGSVHRRCVQILTTPLQVPEMPPHNLACCNIIDLAHALCIKVKVPTCHFDLRMEIPLTIGSEMRSYTATPYYS